MNSLHSKVCTAWAPASAVTPNTQAAEDKGFSLSFQNAALHHNILAVGSTLNMRGGKGRDKEVIAEKLSLGDLQMQTLFFFGVTNNCFHS